CLSLLGTNVTHGIDHDTGWYFSQWKGIIRRCTCFHSIETKHVHEVGVQLTYANVNDCNIGWKVVLSIWSKSLAGALNWILYILVFASCAGRLMAIAMTLIDRG